MRQAPMTPKLLIFAADWGIHTGRAEVIQVLVRSDLGIEGFDSGRHCGVGTAGVARVLEAEVRSGLEFGVGSRSAAKKWIDVGDVRLLGRELRMLPFVD